MTPEVVIRKSRNDKFIVSTKRGEFVFDDLDAVLRDICHTFGVHSSIHFLGEHALILEGVAKLFKDRLTASPEVKTVAAREAVEGKDENTKTD